MVRLTEEQQRIVLHPGGHARVRAVAGSGKTTTMVERIHHLLAKGIAPNNILVLMFNKSARDNFHHTLKNRLTNSSLVSPEVRTFHSLGLRLIESFSRRGCLPKFILKTEEHFKEHLVRQTASQLVENNKDGFDIREKLEEFLDFIELVKAHNSTPEKIAKGIGLPARLSGFITGYKLFEQLRFQHKVRFYSDLIGDPLQALQNDEALRDWVANRVDYIIVDEYQDINESQQQLLRYVAGKRAQLMVVGDGDQCIYEWRGAKPEYIGHRFGEDFENPVDYSLSYTFRYGHQLSLAANYLISNNYDKKRSLCLSREGNFRTEISCQEIVAGGPHPILQIIKDWQSQGRSLEEAAVLVRLYAMSIPVEFALLESGVPYSLAGGLTLFECAEIRALIGYLILAATGMKPFVLAERIDLLKQMFTQPHLGLKRNELERFIAICARNPEDITLSLKELAIDEASQFRQKKLFQIAENYQWLINLTGEEDAALTIKQLISRFELYEFYRNYSVRQASAENSIQACEALIGFAREKGESIAEFLVTFGQLKSAEKKQGEKLLITTVHKAKGLEWPLVVVPGLEQGNFPFEQKQDSLSAENNNYEDERRLF